MSVACCRRRGCGVRLVDRMDALGRLVVGCPACTRNASGICRDCPKPVASPRAMRCVACTITNGRRVARDQARRRRADDTKRQHILATRRRSYRENPAARARILAANAAYRAEHPSTSDESSRACTREWQRRRRKDRDAMLTVSKRRREVAELKRRGLWPAVQTLPANEIPRPRRKLDDAALAARERGPKRGSTRTTRRTSTVDVSVNRPGRGTTVIARTTMLRSA